MADTPAGTTTDHHQPADASASLRVLVVDDHALVRSGVRSELTAHAPELDVIAEADDVEGAIAAVHALRPDVVLLDVHLPGGNGGGGAEVVASCHDVPETRFLALSVSDASDDVVGVIRAGARGYVTKAISTEDLAQAVRRVAAGDAVGPYTMRRATAQRVSSLRLDSCSLRSTAETWVSTVLMLMNSSEAHSR